MKRYIECNNGAGDSTDIMILIDHIVSVRAMNVGVEIRCADGNTYSWQGVSYQDVKNAIKGNQ